MWLQPRARLVRSVPRTRGRDGRRRDDDQDQRGRSPPGGRTRHRRALRAHGRYVRRPRGRRHRGRRIREPGRSVGRARDPSPDPGHRRVSAVHPGRRRGRPAAQRLLPGKLRAGWLCMGVLEGRGRRECRNRREPLEDAKWRARMEEELARHYLIKERLIRIDDETINKVVRAVSEIGAEQLSTPVVLDAIRTKYPEVLKAFDGLL